MCKVVSLPDWESIFRMVQWGLPIPGFWRAPPRHGWRPGVRAGKSVQVKEAFADPNSARRASLQKNPASWPQSPGQQPPASLLGVTERDWLGFLENSHLLPWVKSTHQAASGEAPISGPSPAQRGVLEVAARGGFAKGRGQAIAQEEEQLGPIGFSFWVRAQCGDFNAEIREEDRSPLPTSPPLPFSVIPGGFKQLVRKTEKESKEVKLSEKVTLNSQEDPVIGPVQQFVIQDTDILEVGRGMASSKGRLVQGRLNGEKPAGEGVAELRRGPQRRNAKLSGPDPVLAPCPKALAAEAGKGAAESGPATKTTKGRPPQSQRFESPAKENAKGRTEWKGLLQQGKGAEGTGKGKESGGVREKVGEKRKPTEEGHKRPGEREGEVAEAKKMPGEGLAVTSREGGDARQEPEGIQQADLPFGGRRDQGSSTAEAKDKLEETEKVLAGERQGDPEGTPDSSKVPEDVWYETEKVWLAQKDKFTLATELKPDVGTLELPPGIVRVRVDADGSVVEVDEENVQKANPSSLDYAEDLAALVSLNEASVLHVLHQRYQSQLLYTYSGPHLIALKPPSPVANSSKKAFQGRKDKMSPHIFAMAQRAYWNMLIQRQDQTIVPLGRSNTGKTTSCQNILEYLVATAGSMDNQVTVEKIQAMFTVLRAFGTVSTGLNKASTRFSMVMALDFSATGRVTAAHLQTMLLERARVAQQPEGEGTFNVFMQMLAGLGLDQRSTLHLHQMAENSSFGIRPCLNGEEKQEASAAFSQLRAALGTLGIVAAEQEALWRVLAGIYHLGAAGACKVGRKQFLKFEWADRAADVLGCEVEELTTAVFKHHLQRIIEQVTAGAGVELKQDQEPMDGPKLTGVECLEGMAAGLYEELFAAVVTLINRSFSSSHLSTASLMVVDAPGFLSPRHRQSTRAATFEELCHNYGQERLQALFYKAALESKVGRFQEENVGVPFDLPELSPAAAVALVDQNPSLTPLSSGGSSEDPKGLLWILDEEALIRGSDDGRALDRLCLAFGKEGVSTEEEGVLRRCEQPLQFEVAHWLGKDPVRYDATSWVNKAKWNLSVQNAIQLLQQSRIEALRKVFLPRSGVPLVCRSVAGLEGHSQQALQRIGCVRKTFTSSFAAVRKKSVCAQIKLQLDALSNLVKRSQIHFLHCLDPGTLDEARPPTQTPSEATPVTVWDTPALRAQLSGSLILEALRLYRVGYADRMALTQFRRRFQILAQPEMKKFTSAYEGTDEKKALEELFQALNLEKKSFVVGHTQVFLKTGVLPQLEKQREKLVSQNLVFLQAACKGFLSRQKFKKLKIQGLAARCIQKNLAVFQAVKNWWWWQLMCRVRPLLTISVAEGQLQAKEEELAALRKKLENSEISRQELRQNTELLETKIIDLTAELSDERLKGDVACQALQGERAERLRASKEAKELQSKQHQLQKQLETAEKQLEEAQQQLQLHETGANSSGQGGEWQMRLDCAETEIAFLRKRVTQLEERLEREQQSKADLEQKFSEAQQLYEEARRTARRLKQKCKQLTCELDDARVLMENQQSRNHELEKKQQKFDMQLAQALGESAFEKGLREKVVQENTGLQFQLGRLQQSLEQKELEKDDLSRRVAMLSSQVEELSSSGGLDASTTAALQKKLWDLESRASEQQQELSQQASAVEQLEQLHLRLELEIERTKQIHQKELEDKEEELEDTRKSCQKRLRQLEMQCEQECEEKRTILLEKRDLEGLVATLCEQIGHRDFDVEKRLRRDLKRTRALLADVQLLLETSGADPCPSGSPEEWAKLRGQWEESTARCAEAQESQKMLSLEVENLHSELEAATRNKNLVDEQLYQLQHAKADLLKRIEEDQEDLNELMAKHKALIAQSATDITQIRELQMQLEEVKREKHALQEKLQAAQARLSYLEQAMVERSIVSRQEALICDLENKMEFQSVQIKRFEVLVLRLRDSVIKVGEELEKAREGEAHERENAHYYRLRLEEMKAHASELAQRELEASRKRVDLEKQVDELSAVRQTLQADLETSIRRIADLQAALEEVQSSDESEAESIQTARDSLGPRQEMDSQLSLGSSSTLSLNLESEGSVGSWLETPSGWTSPSAPSLAGSTSQLSTDSRSIQSWRVSKDQEKSWQPMSTLNAKRKEYGRCAGDSAFSKAESPSTGTPRREYGKPICKDEFDSTPKLDGASSSVMRQVSSPAAAEEKFPSPLSPSLNRRVSPLAEDKLSRSSSALSEYVEKLRTKRLKDKEPLDEASSLPIYQTTGASFLRRCRTLKDSEDFQINLDDLGANPGVGLVRTSSLRSISSDCMVRPSLSPALKRASRFGSCDSLVQNIDDTYPKLGSPILGGDIVSTSRQRPWRSCLEPSLEESMDFGKEPLMFQSKRLGEIPSEGKDPFSWKIPTLSYERKTDADLDDFLPAIRKAQSTSSLSRGPKERKDGQRPPSVHFEDQVTPPRTFLSEIKTVLSPQSRSKEDPGNLSDSSSSSGSGVSFKSADSIKCRPKAQRQEGEGCVGKGSTEGTKVDSRSEAEGKEDDVTSIMMKYLGKQ
ncbi:unconventional myosin-XVIIIb [Candoia aspera]|uniref:unconventional myosin-XVIIIb n=1 Tax=Candoia aspera TaxID=51853 RepID=UPI002FD7BF2D